MKIESFFNIYFLFIIIIGIITYVTLLSTTVKKNNNNKVDYFVYILSILFFHGLRIEEVNNYCINIVVNPSFVYIIF